MSFSPKPWRLEQSKLSCIVYDAANKPICEILGNARAGVGGKPERLYFRGDAHLIAAAPKMLEALILMQAYLKSVNHQSSVLVDNAIKRAMGEE